MAQEGKFREDLYYRINVVSLALPPLRERRGDTTLLARYFAENSAVARKAPAKFTKEALAALESYDWPGNVRELHNVIERALILADEQEITVNDLPGNLRGGKSSLSDELTRHRPRLEDLERTYISRLLKEFDGHRARVAEVLGISERTLYRKLKDLQDSSASEES